MECFVGSDQVTLTNEAEGQVFGEFFTVMRSEHWPNSTQWFVPILTQRIQTKTMHVTMDLFGSTLVGSPNMAKTFGLSRPSTAWRVRIAYKFTQYRCKIYSNIPAMCPGHLAKDCLVVIITEKDQNTKVSVIFQIRWNLSCIRHLKFEPKVSYKAVCRLQQVIL